MPDKHAKSVSQAQPVADFLSLFARTRRSFDIGNYFTRFWRWREEKWKRMFVAFLAVVLTLAAMAIYELLIANYLLFILGTALAVLLSLARTRFEKRKLRDFRNQWQPTTRDAHLEENHST